MSTIRETERSFKVQLSEHQRKGCALQTASLESPKWLLQTWPLAGQAATPLESQPQGCCSQPQGCCSQPLPLPTYSSVVLAGMSRGTWTTWLSWQMKTLPRQWQAGCWHPRQPARSSSSRQERAGDISALTAMPVPLSGREERRDLPGQSPGWKIRPKSWDKPCGS